MPNIVGIVCVRIYSLCMRVLVVYIIIGVHVSWSCHHHAYKIYYSDVSVIYFCKQSHPQNKGLQYSDNIFTFETERGL